ncbi:MAG: glycosyl hydrolase family 57 [Magnetococcales bacterium]|nr:glycosyl hydrolase family 57 [Magnetococcales bacterium]
MPSMPSTIGDLPNICGSEAQIQKIVSESRNRPLSTGDFGSIKSAFAIALHMHQPLLPAGGPHLPTAAMISNLQCLLNSPESGDNHNGRVYRSCYKRMGEFIPQLLAEGKAPRVMLEYSGTLMHGLLRMGAQDVLDALAAVTRHPEQCQTIEWLGAPWGHPVAPSTPVQDYRLHVMAWQHHFAAIFGLEALQRVRGFSPSEMALPNHPDVAYAFVKTLRECGYSWVLVQEHSVEDPHTGHPSRQPHVPHRLECRNSHGDVIDIVAIIKTQGSDSKLVGHMQPYYEARSLTRWHVQGREIPPLVTQIADGENGGVMMNEFPSKFMEVMRQSSGTDTPPMTVSEYLEHVFASGIRVADLPVVQPLFHKRIWERVNPGDGPEKVAQTIATLNQEGHGFHMEGGSWTNNLSWVRGYEKILGPMEEVSSLFHEKVLKPGHDASEPRFRNALYHLMLSQTSCFRYWGEGQWTDYGREICRRAKEILIHDFKDREPGSKSTGQQSTSHAAQHEPVSTPVQHEPALTSVQHKSAPEVTPNKPAPVMHEEEEFVLKAPEIEPVPKAKAKAKARIKTPKKEPASKASKKESVSKASKKGPASKTLEKEPDSKASEKESKSNKKSKK